MDENNNAHEYNNHAHFREVTARRYAAVGFLIFFLIAPFSDVIFR